MVDIGSRLGGLFRAQVLLRVVTSVQGFRCPQDLEVASSKRQELQIMFDDSHTPQLLIQRVEGHRCRLHRARYKAQSQVHSPGVGTGPGVG